MKLFQHSMGSIIAFGFDMAKRIPDGSMITWSDRDGKTWDQTVQNDAGWSTFPPSLVQGIDPEFIFEVNGKVLAYQPGLCIEMTYVGAPYVWAIQFMRPTTAHSLARAA